MEKLTLTKVASFFKSEWILLFLGVISISIFILAIVSFSQTKTPKNPPGIPWQNQIYAGTTTKEQLKSILGPPIKIEGEGGQISYFYPSTNNLRPHKVEFLENTVGVIKEQVIGNEKGDLADYLQKLGQPEAVLFGPHGTFAPGHFWSSKGILVFANKFDSTIIEIWYFAPTNLDEFLSNNPQLQNSEPSSF